MKKSLLLCFPLAGIFAALVAKERDTASGAARLLVTPSAAASCGPLPEGDFYTDGQGKFIPLMPGRGKHAYKVNTSSDSAQVYFNQGLTMYYSYHAREAAASFKEAARFDSGCAMAWWGQALALGPSFNYGHTYRMGAAVPGVLQKMNRLAHTATEKERDLIAAMNTRYDLSDTADKGRKALNMAYVEALKPLVKKYPGDIDIKALYTDAVMLVHPWSFWNNDGSPKPWTPELVQYCREILSKDPHHPGALHYYIHVTEASRRPEVALPAADSLIKLFPGIAHMVHMSSHEYERIGYYAKGVKANEKADESLALYDALVKLYPQVHSVHYYAVDAYCALSGNMGEKAVQKCLALRSITQPAKGAMYPQYGHMYLSLARVRMGKWADILKDTSVIPADWSLAVVLDHFSKGMATAKTGNMAASESHLQRLREGMKDPALKEKFAPHASSPYEVARVAEWVLRANQHFIRKRPAEAIAAIRAAIRHEDSLLYSEPKMWMIPARQYLGTFYMQLKQFRQAEQVFREDLVWNPGNGWSLVGLYGALKAQGKKEELGRLKKLYTESFSEAETVPVVAAY